MSYYRLKTISISKDGKINVTAADNNTRPITYFKSEYRGTLGDLLLSIHEGNFKLNNTKPNEKYFITEEVIYSMMRGFDKVGLDWSTCFEYKIGDRNNGAKMICDALAGRMLSDEGYDDEYLAELEEALSLYIVSGLKNLKKVKEEDNAKGRVRCSCASYSIFEGLDLLFPKDGGEALLAPQEDYKAGILETDPKNIIRLGEESRNLNILYPCLSFTGINSSIDDVKRRPHNIGMEDAVEREFNILNDIIKKALDAGAVIKAGVTPYVGYAI